MGIEETVMGSKDGLSRRAFLTGAAACGLVAATAAATGCSPKSQGEGTASDNADAAAADASSSAGIDWLGTAPEITDADCVSTEDVDVLVIGAGTAGYFAACAAAEEGANTLLIEKGDAGNSVRSSALGAVNTKLQKAQGIEINITDMINDFDRLSQGRENMRLLRKWAENSAEAIDWYTDLLAANGMEVQLEWNMPEGTRYTEWPVGHGTNGEYPSREGDVAAIMDAYIQDLGSEVRYRTAMQCLILDGNKVVGVYATNANGENIRINASKGVIVATGGYAYDQKMFEALHNEDFHSNGLMDAFPSCTGDGIKALMWAGASMDSVPSSVSFNRGLLTADMNPLTPYELNWDICGYFFYSSQPFLRVDPNGNRFHNESAPYEYVMRTSANRPVGQRHWHQIWDANWKEDVQRFHTVGCSTICYREGADHDAFPTMLDDWIEPEMEAFVEAGFIVKADTLEELADGLGFNADQKATFLAVCDRQNENFDNQEDPDFGKEAFRLSELRTPPINGTVKSLGFTLCTTDGIRVNDDLQPFCANGVIEGVRVVGNDQGSFYGGVYPNLAAGLNAGRCATFGRMAGKELARG
ncbi:MAG: FAD-dependent oxidoreductase [Eggerthellales bacterium]|nr:FAD-dependent oxidoreductase [Eggerthellales bacterium]